MTFPEPSLTKGGVNMEVSLTLRGGPAGDQRSRHSLAGWNDVIIVASIRKASINALELKKGDEVSAVVKVSQVLAGV